MAGMWAQSFGTWFNDHMDAIYDVAKSFIDSTELDPEGEDTVASCVTKCCCGCRRSAQLRQEIDTYKEVIVPCVSSKNERNLVFRDIEHVGKPTRGSRAVMMELAQRERVGLKNGYIVRDRNKLFRPARLTRGMDFYCVVRTVRSKKLGVCGKSMFKCFLNGICCCWLWWCQDKFLDVDAAIESHDTHQIDKIKQEVCTTPGPNHGKLVNVTVKVPHQCVVLQGQYDMMPLEDGKFDTYVPRGDFEKLKASIKSAKSSITQNHAVVTYNAAIGQFNSECANQVSVMGRLVEHHVLKHYAGLSDMNNKNFLLGRVVDNPPIPTVGDTRF